MPDTSSTEHLHPTTSSPSVELVRRMLCKNFDDQEVEVYRTATGRIAINVRTESLMFHGGITDTINGISFQIDILAVLTERKVGAGRQAITLLEDTARKSGCTRAVAIGIRQSATEFWVKMGYTSKQSEHRTDMIKSLSKETLYS